MLELKFLSCPHGKACHLPYHAAAVTAVLCLTAAPLQLSCSCCCCCCLWQWLCPSPLSSPCCRSRCVAASSTRAEELQRNRPGSTHPQADNRILSRQVCSLPARYGNGSCPPRASPTPLSMACRFKQPHWHIAREDLAKSSWLSPASSVSARSVPGSVPAGRL